MMTLMGFAIGATAGKSIGQYHKEINLKVACTNKVIRVEKIDNKDMVVVTYHIDLVEKKPIE